MVLALLGVLLALGSWLARPDRTIRAAEAVRSVILFARLNAVWRGATVAVTELEGGGGLVARLVEGGGACGPGPELARVPLADHPGVRFAAGLPRGLAWLPSGAGRSCDGGGVVSATLSLVDGRNEARVVVSSLGRVRVEAVP